MRITGQGVSEDGGARGAAAIIIAQDAAAESSLVPGRIEFYTSSSASAFQERMRIDKDGKVGINKTAPGYRFAVEETSGTNYVAQLKHTLSNGAGLLIEAGDAATNPILTLKDKDSNQKVVFRQDGHVGIGNTTPEGTLSLASGKHILAIDQTIRFADSTDNTVIVEISGYHIPAKAIITRVVAVVATDSNLATHEVNINLNTSSGIAVDSAIDSAGSATEILGAGVANTDSTDSLSASDISMGTSAGDEKEVWICNDQIINTADRYIYICNAGTGNGTTNSTAGTLSVIIEYYGVD
jgi:hypothetical protein